MLPPSIRSAYDPGRPHLGPVRRPPRAGARRAGETDPYRATPDELFARGKALFDAGRTAEAAGPLEELFDGYTLRDDIAKDAARMLLLIHIDQDQPRKVVSVLRGASRRRPLTWS